MLSKKLLPFIFCLLSFYLHSQNNYYELIERTFASQEFRSVLQLNNGNFFTVGAGVSFDLSKWSALNIVYNNELNVYQNNNFYNSYESIFFDAHLIDESNILLVGRINISTNYFLYYQKYNLTNNTVTDYNFYGLDDRSMGFTTPTKVDDNFFIAGASYINYINNIDFDNNGGKELTLFKLNSNLDILLDTVYTQFPKHNEFKALFPSENGGVYAFAKIEGDEFELGTDRLMFCEIDSFGNFLWQEFYDFGDKMDAYDVIKTNDNGFLLSFASELSLFDTESWLYKLDSNLNVEWFDDYVIGNGYPKKILQLTNSEYIVVGNHYENDLSINLSGVIVKLDANGNKLWQREYRGPRHIYFNNAIVVDDDLTGNRGFAIVGRRDSAYYNPSPPSPVESYGGAASYFLKVNCMGLINDPIVNFSSSSSSLTVNYTNQSKYIYADSIDGGNYVLDFGDGNSQSFNTDFSTANHTFANAGYYESILTGYVCNDTVNYKATVCAGVGLPNIVFDLQSAVSIISDSTMLLQIDNNSTNLSSYSSHYQWFANGIAFGENDSNIVNLVLPLADTINLQVQTGQICDSIFTYESELISACVNPVYPNINFDIDANAIAYSLDTTLLVEFSNNSTNLDGFFADYQWTINDNFSFVNNNSTFSLDVPFDSILNIELSVLFCDSAYVYNEIFDANCDALLNPQIFFNANAAVLYETTDSTMLLQVNNNSSNLLFYFAEYQWLINGIYVTNSENSFTIEIPKATVVNIELSTSTICGTIYTYNFDLAVDCATLVNPQIDFDLETDISFVSDSLILLQIYNNSTNLDVYSSDYNWIINGLIFTNDSNYIEITLPMDTLIEIEINTNAICDSVYSFSEIIAIDCFEILNPQIIWDVQTEVSIISDSLMLLEIINNSEDLSSNILNYNWNINNVLTFTNDSNYIALELPIDTFISVQLNTNAICDSVYSFSEIVEIDCFDILNPQIIFDFEVEVIEILSNTVQLEISNNSTNLNTYFANYQWIINDSILFSDEILFEIELPLDSFVTIQLSTSQICDSIFRTAQIINIFDFVGIQNNFNHCNFTIKPNPFDNFLKIENIADCNVNATNLSIALYDLKGKLLLNKPILNGFVTTNVLPKGMFVYKIADETGFVLDVGKLVK